MSSLGEKREVSVKKQKGLSVLDILTVGVLLAIGIVLKSSIGSMFTVMGMKPNFIISMYVLAIVLIKPKMLEAAVIGILAGVVCQFFPGTPYINILSEAVGALTAAAVLHLPFPMSAGRYTFRPVVAAFISTLISGLIFISVLYAMVYAGSEVKAMPLQAFMIIVLGTAFINSIIVQALYPPLKIALKKD